MFIAHELEAARDGFVGGRIDVFESQVFQLNAHTVDTDTTSQRGIDFQCLERDAFTLFRTANRVQRLHVVQTVAQLDDQNPHIVGNRDDEFLQVFRLFGAFGAQLHLTQLGHTGDQIGHLFTKQLDQLFVGRRCILHGIVEQAGADSGDIHAQIGKDHRHRSDMRKIGFAGLPSLRPMCLFRKVIGFAHIVAVDLRKIIPDTVNQLVRAGNGGRRRSQFF